MTRSLEKLENLVKARQLKAEPPDQAEFDGLLKSAAMKLPDARNPGLSTHSRFDLAYNAAHSLALAALRWHGFRAENRYIVFQLLESTVLFPPTKCRVLDNCHRKRNLALYEGDYAEDEQLISELIKVAGELEVVVNALGPVGR
jgi:hypothetical protein